MSNHLGYEEELKKHIEQERAAVKLQSKVGELLYDQGIELVLFRHHLVDITISEILNLHEYAGKVVHKPIDVFSTAMLAEELSYLNLRPAKLDIGKLANEWISSNQQTTASAFLKEKLAGFDQGETN